MKWNMEPPESVLPVHFVHFFLLSKRPQRSANGHRIADPVRLLKSAPGKGPRATFPILPHFGGRLIRVWKNAKQRLRVNAGGKIRGREVTMARRFLPSDPISQPPRLVRTEKTSKSRSVRRER
jgi:hypothetical protein